MRVHREQQKEKNGDPQPALELAQSCCGLVDFAPSCRRPSLPGSLLNKGTSWDRRQLDPRVDKRRPARLADTRQRIIRNNETKTESQGEGTTHETCRAPSLQSGEGGKKRWLSDAARPGSGKQTLGERQNRAPNLSATTAPKTRNASPPGTTGEHGTQVARPTRGRRCDQPVTASKDRGLRTILGALITAPCSCALCKPCSRFYFLLSEFDKP